jgi:hypothetical protein
MGAEVKVIDSFIEGYSLEELIEIIIKEKPEIVGLLMRFLKIRKFQDIKRGWKSLKELL